MWYDNNRVIWRLLGYDVPLLDPKKEVKLERPKCIDCRGWLDENHICKKKGGEKR